MESFHFRDGSYVKLLRMVEKVVQGKIEDRGLCAYRVLLLDGDQVNGKVNPLVKDISHSHYVTVAASSTPQKLDAFRQWADMIIQADNKKDSSDMYLQLVFQHLVTDVKCIGVDIITIDQALISWLKGFATICDLKWRVNSFSDWNEWKDKVGDINISALTKLTAEAQKKAVVDKIISKGTDKPDEIWQYRDISDAFALLRYDDRVDLIRKNIPRKNLIRAMTKAESDEALDTMTYLRNKGFGSMKMTSEIKPKEDMNWRDDPKLLAEAVALLGIDGPGMIDEAVNKHDTVENVIVGCHLISIVGDQIGLVKEKGHKLFGFVGGKIQAKETCMECLIREIKEEINYDYRPNGYEQWKLSPGMSADGKTLWNCNYIIDLRPFPGLTYVKLSEKALNAVGVEGYVYRVLRQEKLI